MLLAPALPIVLPVVVPMFTLPPAALIPVKVEATALFIVMPDTVLPCNEVADAVPTFA